MYCHNVPCTMSCAKCVPILGMHLLAKQQVLPKIISCDFYWANRNNLPNLLKGFLFYVKKKGYGNI